MYKIILMKNLFAFGILIMTFPYNAQLNYVDTDWIIDQTQIMSDGQEDTLQLDIDEDGTLDMRITSWSNHQTGIYTVTEVLMLDAVSFGGLETTSCGYIEDCPSTGFTYSDIAGYIYTSNCGSNPYSGQYVKMPFKIQGTTGVHCGFLYVRYVGTTITIEGYAWNPTVNGTCSCSSSGWLALNELTPQSIEDNPTYINLLGQKVENPDNMVFRIYDSGVVDKVFIIK